uniref:Uncharacterized protein n=1 Tax=Anguilla anguilla TaxID=7936 RepID=A0A0E9XJL9_ANGAN
MYSENHSYNTGVTRSCHRLTIFYHYVFLFIFRYYVLSDPRLKAEHYSSISK